jgi:hypothetical protein
MICFFFSCNSGIEKPQKPENLIPEDKMVDIMYDMFLLNSAKGVNKTILEVNGIMPEKYLFEKHSIDSTQFAESNNYYVYNTKTYESILNRIKEKIDLKKKEYDALEKIEDAERQKKADSILAERKKLKDSLIKVGEVKLKEK